MRRHSFCFKLLFCLAANLAVGMAISFPGASWKSEKTKKNDKEGDESAPQVETSRKSAHDDEDEVVSPACAAALLTARSVVAGVAASAILAELPAILGFASSGVEEGSFAAWWQSTMPNVAKGSCFSKLQSIAMGGASAASGENLAATFVFTKAGAVGGIAASHYLKRFCSTIDREVSKQDSKAGTLLKKNLAAVKKIGQAEDWAIVKTNQAWESSKEAREQVADRAGKAANWTKDR